MAEGIEGADEGDKGWLDLHMREKISGCNPKSFPGLHASSSSDRLHIAPSELGPATAFL